MTELIAERQTNNDESAFVNEDAKLPILAFCVDEKESSNDDKAAAVAATNKKI